MSEREREMVPPSGNYMTLQLLYGNQKIKQVTLKKFNQLLSIIILIYLLIFTNACCPNVILLC